MKKLAIILIVLLAAGCSNKKALNSNDIPINTVISSDIQIKTVENYNDALFDNNLDEAMKYLDGYAKNTFKTNINKYKSASNLISQDNVLETSGNNFSVVKSKIDLEVFKDSKTKVLQREWVRYSLLKDKEWKIVKVEKLPIQYPTNLYLEQNIQEDASSAVVKDFIGFCAEGNISEASKYLSGELLNNAERYRVDHIPKSTLGNIKITILAGDKENRIINAVYSLNGKQLKAIFHLININGTWLIDDQII